MSPVEEPLQRRTFAIISHPDAGKTTLTEKLLLYAGALHVAGSIKARKSGRHAVSDWMQMEQERGISITSSVLQFDHEGRRLNLVDTPGHADFSEDTYRTLAAVDSAVMLLDAMKGVEDRTRRLFEVCRLRLLPILTFVNKLDRLGRDPFDLMDEVAKVLQIRTVPLNWPIGEGPDFRGVFDLRTRRAHLYERVERGAERAREQVLEEGSALRQAIGESAHVKLVEELELLGAADPWSPEDFLAGELTPFFFGSAMTNFGVAPVLQALCELAPAPRGRATATGERRPEDPAFSGFVFKIQANMNPRHRDRIAFLRVVSGRFERGMEALVARTGETLRLNKPHTFVASERSLVDEAVPGDIVGLFDPGALRIGDTLSTEAGVRFAGIPRFAPEHFARVKLADPARRKALQAGLEQLSQEGAIQLFYREGLGPSDPYLGAVGLLQFEVLQARLQQEYHVTVRLEMSNLTTARWLVGDAQRLAWFEGRSDFVVVRDRDDRHVVLASSSWSLHYAAQEVKGIELHEISPL
jgi:peptide chain release factor 3